MLAFAMGSRLNADTFDIHFEKALDVTDGAYAAINRGFARYLRTANKGQLAHICTSDPDYFFRLAPYALALGLETSFAKRFGGLRLDRCPYLTTGMDGHMTALQWSALMRRAVDSMNDRANRLPLEKTIRLIRNITRG